MIENLGSTGPAAVSRATTAELRANFLIDGLFAPGEFRATYLNDDRMVVGGIVPGAEDIRPTGLDAIGAQSLLERRELGVINLGEAGHVVVDGETFELGHHDGLYVGRGADVVFGGEGAIFYLVSATAHATLPTVAIPHDSVEAVVIPDDRGAGARRLYRYVWGGGVPSCQLQFGLTILEEGSAWNTLPPHRHSRRTEVYLYTDLGPDDRVMHVMGEPSETRHLVVANHEAVVAPSWSLHFGAGSSPYAFVWAMAGENTDYGDLEPVKVADLR